jgi:hypothetical protein
MLARCRTCSACILLSECLVLPTDPPDGPRPGLPGRRQQSTGPTYPSLGEPSSITLDALAYPTRDELERFKSGTTPLLGVDSPVRAEIAPRPEAQRFDSPPPPLNEARPTSALFEPVRIPGAPLSSPFLAGATTLRTRPLSRLAFPPSAPPPQEAPSEPTSAARPTVSEREESGSKTPQTAPDSRPKAPPDIPRSKRAAPAPVVKATVAPLNRPPPPTKTAAVDPASPEASTSLAEPISVFPKGLITHQQYRALYQAVDASIRPEVPKLTRKKVIKREVEAILGLPSLRLSSPEAREAVFSAVLEGYRLAAGRPKPAEARPLGRVAFKAKLSDQEDIATLGFAALPPRPSQPAPSPPVAPSPVGPPPGARMRDPFKAKLSDQEDIATLGFAAVGPRPSRPVPTPPVAPLPSVGLVGAAARFAVPVLPPPEATVNSEPRMTPITLGRVRETLEKTTTPEPSFEQVPSVRRDKIMLREPPLPATGQSIQRGTERCLRPTH